MQKIIKLVTNEYLPKELPHGGILMNDGEDIDFTNFAIEPEPCPECPEVSDPIEWLYVTFDNSPIFYVRPDLECGSLEINEDSNWGMSEIVKAAVTFIDEVGNEYPNTLAADKEHIYHYDDLLDKHLILKVSSIERLYYGTSYGLAGGINYYYNLEDALDYGGSVIFQEK